MNYSHIQFRRQTFIFVKILLNCVAPLLDCDCMVRRPNWSPDQIGRPTKLVARPWSLNGRSMVARLLWPPALSHRPKGGGKGRAAIYLGARPFWAPAQNGRSGLFKTAEISTV